MSRSERLKGKAGELEVVHAFTDAGFPCRRSGDAGQIIGDLDGLPNIYAEVRRRERLSIPTWIREVESKRPGDSLGLLVFRRSREDWHVCLGLDAFLSLLKEAR